MNSDASFLALINSDSRILGGVGVGFFLINFILASPDRVCSFYQFWNSTFSFFRFAKNVKKKEKKSKKWKKK